MTTDKPKILLQGGGEHAAVVLDCLLDCGYDVRGIFDPRLTGNLFAVPQLGKYEPLTEPDAKMIISIGDNRVRKQVAAKCSHAFFTVVHTSAVVSSRASIGAGTMVLHRAVVQARSRIGDHVILNTGCQIDHDCVVGDYVHIGPRAVLCGCVTVGEGAFIGAGATIIPGIRIGQWSVVGAGSVVIRDVPDNAVVAGNPARAMKIPS